MCPYMLVEMFLIFNVDSSSIYGASNPYLQLLEPRCFFTLLLSSSELSSSLENIEKSHTFSFVFVSIVFSLCFGFDVSPNTMYLTTGTRKFCSCRSFWALFSWTYMGWKTFIFSIDFLFSAILLVVIFKVANLFYSKLKLVSGIRSELMILTFCTTFFWRFFLGHFVYVSLFDFF